MELLQKWSWWKCLSLEQEKHMFSISRMSTVQIYDANMGGVNFCEMLQNKQVLLPYCLIYVEYLSPMDSYFIADTRTKNVFLWRNQLSMLEFQTVTANNLWSAGKLASASRLSHGRSSLNTTIKEATKSIDTNSSRSF